MKASLDCITRTYLESKEKEGREGRGKEKRKLRVKVSCWSINNRDLLAIAWVPASPTALSPG